jgi:sirohydrochlorin cobaltochelatase
MAEPAFDQVLDDVDPEMFGRVVIQPHLLFVGRMLSSLRQRVETLAKSYPDNHWSVSEHLGRSPLLTSTIVDLIERSGCTPPSGGLFGGPSPDDS